MEYVQTCDKRKISCKQIEVNNWIAQENTCERCGKIMTEKYRSGRFCSSSCAHSRDRAVESNRKLKQTQADREVGFRVINAKKHKHSLNKYLSNPIFCCICGKQIPYEKRYAKTCSKKCKAKYLGLLQKQKVENGTHKGWMRRSKISYPEQFWIKVLENNKIDYIHEKPISVNDKQVKANHYLLDFFIEPNIDLEIDGGQHNLEDNKLHDQERDLYLKSIGYLVYRIKWINPAKDALAVRNQIDNLLKFINEHKRA